MIPKAAINNSDSKQNIVLFDRQNAHSEYLWYIMYVNEANFANTRNIFQHNNMFAIKLDQNLISANWTFKPNNFYNMRNTGFRIGLKSVGLDGFAENENTVKLLIDINNYSTNTSLIFDNENDIIMFELNMIHKCINIYKNNIKIRSYFENNIIVDNQFYTFIFEAKAVHKDDIIRVELLKIEIENNDNEKLLNEYCQFHALIYSYCHEKLLD